MTNIPPEQLAAIAQFWADRYQGKSTPEQLEIFKQALQEAVERKLQECAWKVDEPLWGSYSRKFITFHEYHSSETLNEALIAAGLKTGMLVFPWGTTLSIDPGSVTTHPAGEIIWQAPT